MVPGRRTPGGRGIMKRVTVSGGTTEVWSVWSQEQETEVRVRRGSIEVPSEKMREIQTRV